MESGNENFFDDKGNDQVNPILFSDIAKQIAEGFIGKNKDGYYAVSRSQIRRLYDEVKRYDQKLDGKPGKWEKYLAPINMIKSKVSYNVARAIKKKESEKDVYNNLSKFFEEWFYNKVKDEKDYHVFTTLFEAVYGFYYKETVDKNIKGGN